jgi:hypothetical protein
MEVSRFVPIPTKFQPTREENLTSSSRIREEQHDDQILNELLRSFKALTLTSCGRSALVSQGTSPFLPLANLLFSEKRPGDLHCRQLLIELIASLFQSCPTSIVLPLLPEDWSREMLISNGDEDRTPGSSIRADLTGVVGKRYTRKMKDEMEAEEDDSSERERRAHDFVNALMLGPGSEKERAKVDFIQASHRPRVYKAWVRELADTVRDYFW